MKQELAACTVHVIGLGLMGGSLAMALRGKVARLTAEDIAPDVLEAALKGGVIDAVGVAAEADIVVLAIPTHLIIDAIPALKVRPGALVIDLGSTKTRICDALDAPAAGRAGRGRAPDVRAGRERLPTRHPDAVPRRAVRALRDARAPPTRRACWPRRWSRAVGAQPLWMDRARQDHLTALTSHLPHLLSFALMRLAMDGQRRKTRRSTSWRRAASTARHGWPVPTQR